MRERVVTFSGLDTESSPTERPAELLQTATNVRLDQAGVVQQRRGYTLVLASNLVRDGQQVISWRADDGSYPLAIGVVSSTGGRIYNSASSSLYSSSQGKRPRFTIHNRRLYVTDGWRPMQRWDGIAAATVAAGITGPSTTPAAWAPTPTTAAGSCTAGTHKFRYRYLDSTTGYVSEPSNEYVATVVAGSQQLTFAISTSGSGNMIRSTDTKVDKIVVEMTMSGGTVFYKAAETIQTASSVVVSIADVTLANQTLPWPDTDALFNGVHYPPPIASHALSFRGRLWLFGQVIHSDGTVAVTNGSASVTGTSTDWTAACALPSAPIGTNRVVRRFKVASAAVDYEVASTGGATSLTLSSTYAGSTTSGLSYTIYSRDRSIFYSEPGYPEAFPPLNFILGPDSGDVRGMIGHTNALLICSLNGMDRFVWTSDPATDGTKRTLPTNRGVVAHECLVNVEEVVYGLDRRGFWRFDGEVPIQISREIETLVARINWTYENLFSACFYPKLRAIRWWVAMDSDTKCHNYFQYDVDRRSWSYGSRNTGALGAGVGHVTLVPTTSGVEVLGVSTQPTGNTRVVVYHDDKGDSDGATTASIQQGTIGSGGTSTTTRLYLSGLTLSGASDYHNAPIYVEGLGASTIGAVSTSPVYVDLNVALASVPEFGTRVHLGYIPTTIKTKAFRSKALNSTAKHAGKTLTIHFVPVTPATGEVARAKVRIYRDWSATAMTWGRTAANNVSVAGATPPAADETDWLIDLTTADGVVGIPLGVTSVQVTEVEIEQTDAGVPLKLLGLSLDGVDLEPVE